MGEMDSRGIAAACQLGGSLVYTLICPFCAGFCRAASRLLCERGNGDAYLYRADSPLFPARFEDP